MCAEVLASDNFLAPKYFYHGVCKSKVRRQYVRNANELKTTQDTRHCNLKRQELIRHNQIMENNQTSVILTLKDKLMSLL